MRTRHIVLTVATVGLLAVLCLWALVGEHEPAKRGLEVYLVGSTNDSAGATYGRFAISNHGPGQLLLWEPGVIEIQGSTAAEMPPSRTGSYIQPGEAMTNEILLGSPSSPWRAGFYYDLSGFREKVEQWERESRDSAPMVKAVWSEWIEP